MSDELNVHGNISKKSGFMSEITNEELDYIADKLADMEFQTRLIDALNTESIYKDRGFWNAIIELLKKKVDVIDGKGLSANDYTTEDKEMLSALKTAVENVSNTLQGKVNTTVFEEALSEKVDSGTYNTDILNIKNSKLNKADVDSALSEASTNPVQNKAIAVELKKKVSESDITKSISNASTDDEIPTAKAAFELLRGKMNFKGEYAGDTVPDTAPSAGDCYVTRVNSVGVNPSLEYPVVINGLTCMVMHAGEDKTTLFISGVDAGLAGYIELSDSVYLDDSDTEFIVSRENTAGNMDVKLPSGSEITDYPSSISSIKVIKKLSVAPNNLIVWDGMMWIVAGKNESTGGTADHSKMDNLDFESSGHTGFQKELTIDSELSDASTNPIQNKVVTSALSTKADAPVLYSTAEDDVTVVMEQNQNALMGWLTSLTLSAPESVHPSAYESRISFKSGTTATVFTDNTGFTFVGDDVSADGVFTPQANKGYELAAKTLGPHGVVVRVGAF